MMAALETLLEKLFPYLVALVVGAGLGMWARGIEADRVLGAEQKAHAADVAKYEKQIGAMNAAAALADEKALADHRAQEGRIATLDDQLTKEKQAHENDARTYAAALAAGTQRLRVAVTHCSARRDDVPAASPAASVDDGTPAYADLDPAVAGRVFRVADDDQQQIDKLRGLQAYVCSIAPGAPSCAGSSATAPTN
jgi:hypothetical protein